MLRSRIIGTIIIVLFLAHPIITTSMFGAFSCTEIDGVSRLFQDLEISCSSPSQEYFSLKIALPGLLIWGLGIPFFAYYLIY